MKQFFAEIDLWPDNDTIGGGPLVTYFMVANAKNHTDLQEKLARLFPSNVIHFAFGPVEIKLKGEGLVLMEKG